MTLTCVFVDSNELFPFTVMDLILTLAEDQLFEFVWSEELLDEWERVIVDRGKRTKESARSVASTVRESFKDGRIDPKGYLDKEWPELPDIDDRVHGAAATEGANVLLTRNLDDFPQHMLPTLKITTSDEYLTSLFRHRQRDFILELAVVHLARIAADLRATTFLAHPATGVAP